MVLAARNPVFRDFSPPEQPSQARVSRRPRKIIAANTRVNRAITTVRLFDEPVAGRLDGTTRIPITEYTLPVATTNVWSPTPMALGQCCSLGEVTLSTGREVRQQRRGGHGHNLAGRVRAETRTRDTDVSAHTHLVLTISGDVGVVGSDQQRDCRTVEEHDVLHRHVDRVAIGVEHQVLHYGTRGGVHHGDIADGSRRQRRLERCEQRRTSGLNSRHLRGCALGGRHLRGRDVDVVRLDGDFLSVHEHALRTGQFR